MTALRPERDSATPYGEDTAYGGAAAFEAPGGYGGAMQAAVDGLADPLSDPLPGGQQQAPPQQQWYDPQAYAPDWSVGTGQTGAGQTGAGPTGGGQSASAYAEPVQRAYTQPAHGYSDPQAPYTPPPQQSPYAQPQVPYQQAGPSYAGPRTACTGSQQPYAQPQPQSPQRQPQQPQQQRSSYTEPPRTHDAAYAPPYGRSPAAGETVALPVTDAGPGTRSRRRSTPSAAPVGPPDGVGAPGGRAARRKAAKRHGRHGGSGGTDTDGVHEEQTDAGAADAPASRTAARRAAKARKPGAAVMVSRAVGEVFITAGVLMLLFVTYQLYWTNIRAQAQADSAASSLQEDWANGKRNPGAFEPGQGFALLHIPKLDVVVPIAEGIDKKRVLDRGMVGHYAEEGVKTAMPDARQGNFGLAGHRNTHGEPFRYINRLKPGDPIVVETQDTYYVYEMASILPVTAPSNTAVLDAIPKGSTFRKPGRYITLTTCTPEFTSKYRMIVWGAMAEERPRDKGKPDALVG